MKRRSLRGSDDGRPSTCWLAGARARALVHAREPALGGAGGRRRQRPGCRRSGSLCRCCPAPLCDGAGRDTGGEQRRENRRAIHVHDVLPIGGGRSRATRTTMARERRGRLNSPVVGAASTLPLQEACAVAIARAPYEGVATSDREARPMLTGVNYRPALSEPRLRDDRSRREASLRLVDRSARTPYDFLPLRHLRRGSSRRIAPASTSRFAALRDEPSPGDVLVRERLHRGLVKLRDTAFGVPAGAKSPYQGVEP